MPNQQYYSAEMKPVNGGISNSQILLHS